jgi:hypothetical protein
MEAAKKRLAGAWQIKKGVWFKTLVRKNRTINDDKCLLRYFITLVSMDIPLLSRLRRPLWRICGEE